MDNYILPFPGLLHD